MMVVMVAAAAMVVELLVHISVNRIEVREDCESNKMNGSEREREK